MRLERGANASTAMCGCHLMQGVPVLLMRAFPVHAMYAIRAIYIVIP
jgi:hypothetical protein